MKLSDGILIGVAVVGIGVALFPLVEVSAKGGAERQRLELQADFESGSSNSIHAVCDTGNGVMLYTFGSGDSRGGVAIAAVPNGCAVRR